jgi:inorganic pyrophosphatase
MIPDTMAEDGDPLDVMVCVSEPTFPGCVIPVKVIALFRMRDDKGQDDKLVCVPLEDPNWNTMDVLDDIPQNLRDEISHFFSVYKTPEGKVVKVDGWYEREAAMKVLEDSRKRWEDGKKAD